MKFGLFNNSIICLALSLLSCANNNSSKENNTASQVESKDNAAIKHELVMRRDSLKVLVDDAIVKLDSLIGVKSSLSAPNAELNKQIDSLKEEANALLIQMESMVNE